MPTTAATATSRVDVSRKNIQRSVQLASIRLGFPCFFNGRKEGKSTRVTDETVSAAGKPDTAGILNLYPHNIKMTIDKHIFLVYRFLLTSFESAGKEIEKTFRDRTFNGPSADATASCRDAKVRYLSGGTLGLSWP